MGAVNGTLLTWIPAPPPGAPPALESGEVVEFSAKDPFVVKSQNQNYPFYLSNYMTGGEAYGGTGDPEWVDSIPAEQYLKEYVLFADPRTPRRASPCRACAGRTGALRTSSSIAQALSADERGWRIRDHDREPRHGQFRERRELLKQARGIKSEAPFGVTVWGWGTIPGVMGGKLFTQYVSYAYPGAGVEPVNQCEIPVPK